MYDGFGAYKCDSTEVEVCGIQKSKDQVQYRINNILSIKQHNQTTFLQWIIMYGKHFLCLVYSKSTPSSNKTQVGQLKTLHRKQSLMESSHTNDPCQIKFRKTKTDISIS